MNESIVEDAALEWFGELGYAGGRAGFIWRAVLVRCLSEAIRRLNPAIPEEAQATGRLLLQVQFERRQTR